MEGANIISILLMIGLIISAAFFQFPILVWTALIAAFLLAITFFLKVSIILLVVLWLGFLIVAACANLHKLRQRYLITPALARMRKQMPAISNTEREAIEAGNTWWEKDLFCGRPSWKKLFSIPQPTLSAEELNFLDNQVEQLCAMFNDWEVVYEKKDLPEEVWSYLKKEKFLGMVIPKQYGGLGFSALAHSTIVVKIATRSLSAAVNTMVPNSLGPAELLFHYGTEEQKNYYLPRLATGEEIPCFALTAPEAGSDAGSIPDTGIICRGEYEGKLVTGIRLNWDKRYITLAPVATVLGLAVHLYDPDHLLGDKEDIGITLCLLPASHPGVELGNRHYPIFQAFMNGPTKGKDVFIPMDWIIGGPQMAGQGWRMLMESLSVGRSISLPALSTACGKMTYRFTGAYARIRKQFNMPIGYFGGIEQALAEIAGGLYLLESSRLMTAGAVDQKIKPAIASAIAKYHMTELSRSVVAHAMDIHAGQSIQVGPRNLLANAHIAIPISITVEGANILTRNLIIFGQGAIRCHPYLLKEVKLISEPEPNIAELDRTLMAHIGFYVSNFIRALAFGLTGGLFIFTNVKNKKIKYYQRQLTRMSTALALLADTSVITLGGSLKRRERISARLGDILSQLYLASTVLKYYKDNKCPASDVDYVCWALSQCLYKIQIAANGLFENLPNRFLASFLRLVIFPFGQAYKSPSDKLSKSIVESMLEPSELRDRLTRYCYISRNGDEITARLEKGLAQVSSIDPIWKKLNKGVKDGTIAHWYHFEERVRAARDKGILSADEADKLSRFEALKNEIIKVNEFSFDLQQVIA